MPTVVDFKPDNANEGVIKILETALEMARNRELVDVAVCGATVTDDGPGIYVEWHGYSQYAVLLAAVDTAKFDMQHMRKREAEEAGAE